jgi:hypothetical protein
VNQGLRVVAEHLARLEPLQIKSSWLHGSLILGGYHHGISDQDLIVLLDHPLTADESALIAESHRQAGPQLSAAYLLTSDDPELEHPTWTHGWSGNRRVSLITRAELHQAHPKAWPPVVDLPVIVAEEVRRAWRRELRAPRTWLRTEYVDLSLTSLVRALVRQHTGVLCSKDEAISVLEEHGVPARLAAAIRTRRQGGEARPHARVLRAVQSHRTARTLLAQL